MKTILFFDTETTGKPLKYNAPVSDVANWPRLVEIGWIVMYENGMSRGSGSAIIRPDGFKIPKEASDIHGITQEQAWAEGIDLHNFLTVFSGIVDRSDVIVGHNIEFDLNVMGAEFIRVLETNPLEGKPSICTMKSGTEFCRLPKTTNRGTDKYKWPRLGELYFALFGVEMPEAHHAVDDIHHTTQCYFEMKSRGIV